MTAARICFITVYVDTYETRSW